MTIVRRTPVRELTTLRNVVDRFFDDTSFRPMTWGGWAEARLPMDITSTEDALLIEAALPGIHPEDVEITVHQDTLTIGVREQAEQATREGERVYRELRRSGGSRTMTLPSGLDVDHATASFENGMLKLEIPRAEQAKPRQIPVTTVSEGGPASVTATSEGAEAPAESTTSQA